MDEGLRSIAEHFAIPETFCDAAPLGSGHIHETFVGRYRGATGPVRYVHQRLNTRIFPDPEAVMRNVVRVTDHLRRKLERSGTADVERRVLTLVAARDGRAFVRDDAGGFWRTYRFIEGARSHDLVECPAQAHEAARAFGVFVAALADLGGPPLEETIPGFHDLAGRADALAQAEREDRGSRVAGVSAELELAWRGLDFYRDELAAYGVDALPQRTVHNDCKLNNVLLDDASGEALCVIDLDTVMAGSVLCDFGELVRTATCRAPEDETNLDRLRLEPELFQALARGYLCGARGLLRRPELDALHLAGPLLTLENAIRFLTDHLDGDRYFRVHRAGHNLDRARVQLRLLELQTARLGSLRDEIGRVAGDLQ